MGLCSSIKLAVGNKSTSMSRVKSQECFSSPSPIYKNIIWAFSQIDYQLISSCEIFIFWKKKEECVYFYPKILYIIIT